MQAVDPDVFKLVAFVNQCEGGGWGSSRILPSQLLRETAFYLNLRSIILSEKSRIEKIKKEKEKAKGK
jgi:hypothetical protein